MLGPLRETCEGALASLKGTGLVRSAGVDAVWQAFVADPESPVWSRAFALCVLGRYLDDAKAGRAEARAPEPGVAFAPVTVTVMAGARAAPVPPAAAPEPTTETVTEPT
jgi:hypothetical protein